MFENQPKSLITNCWKFWSIIPDSLAFTQVERQFNYCMDDHNFQVPLMKQNWIESAFNKLFPSHITEMTSRETEKKHCGTFSTIGSSSIVCVPWKTIFWGGLLGTWGLRQATLRYTKLHFFSAGNFRYTMYVRLKEVHPRVLYYVWEKSIKVWA